MNKKNKYHYFYKITNNINDHFYYGVHNTNNLDDGYMGSGKRLHYAYKKYGMENFTKEILKFFDTSKEAFEYEAKIVNETLVEDPNCYNIIQGGFGWSTKGLVSVKDKDGNTFLCSINDPNYLSGEYMHISTGYVVVKDKDNNILYVSKNDPRYLSGELVYIFTDRISVKDKNGHVLSVLKDDHRYLSGELVGIAKGNVTVKDKNNNYYHISKNDPRYLSGELVPIWKDWKHKNETKLKIKEHHLLIEHNKGEKNPMFGTCWIHNNKESKRIIKDDLQQWLNSGWIKGRKMKFD